MGLCVHCHWATKTYEDSVIYTLGDIRRPLDRYKIGYTKMDKVIWTCYKQNKFYYGTNDVGGLVEAFVTELKMN